MKVWQMKKILENFDDNLEIFIKGSNSGIGNITEVEGLDEDAYRFLGETFPCLIVSHEDKCKSDCGNCKIYCEWNDDNKYNKKPGEVEQ